MDYQLKPLGKTCAQTGQKLLPGEVCYSAVVPKGNQWERIDVSRDAWKGPPDGAIGFWTCTVPAETQTRRPARPRRPPAALRTTVRRSAARA